MSYLEERVKELSTNPVERAKTEKYLEAIGNSQPGKATLWRAVQNGDVKTVDRILTQRDIARTRERLKRNPTEATEDYLKHLLKHLEKLIAF